MLVAFEQGDQATLRSLILPSEDTLFIGSDASEWLYGFEAVEVSSAQASAAEYSLTIHRIDAHEAGHIGWAAADTTADFSGGLTADFRVTAVFRLEAGVWKVVQWHASVPSPINETSGRVVPTSLGQLLDDLDEDLERALRARFQTSVMTFVFSDIEASTHHNEALGDAVWGDVVQRHFAEVERVAMANDGEVVKTLGDGTMVAFRRPLDGVRAAMAIQRSVRRKGPGRPFRVRIGVHTGEALHLDGDYLGQTVNATARLTAVAAGGQVLVSAAALDGLDQLDGLTLGEPKALKLDGISGTVAVRPLMVD
jgi:class 3 adenylate cyclase